MSFFHERRIKKITILLGHPDKESTHSSELALLYEVSAKKAGHEVKRFNIADMQFDPILHQGYKKRQNLEPDLVALQDAIKWCDHFVLIYPTWWCSMPALLKGLFDRMWLAGFAFKFYKTGWRAALSQHEKLLAGKTARVITPSAVQPLLLQIFQSNHTSVIKKSILGFAGLKTSVTRFGPSLKAPEWKWNEWRHHVAQLGKLGI